MPAGKVRTAVSRYQLGRRRRAALARASNGNLENRLAAIAELRSAPLFQKDEAQAALASLIIERAPDVLRQHFSTPPCLREDVVECLVAGFQVRNLEVGVVAEYLTNTLDCEWRRAPNVATLQQFLGLDTLFALIPGSRGRTIRLLVDNSAKHWRRIAACARPAHGRVGLTPREAARLIEPIEGSGLRALGTVMDERLAPTSPQPPTDQEEAKQWIDEYWKDWRASLHQSEREALCVMKRNDYLELNDALERNSKTDLWRHVDELDRALHLEVTPCEIVLFRGENGSNATSRTIDWVSRAKRGDRLHVPRYWATSTTQCIAEAHARHALRPSKGLLMAIEIPAGSMCAAMDLISPEGNNELLLPRDSEFELLGKEVDSHGFRTAQLRLVPSPTA